VDIKRKLRVLADAAKYDASCASSGSKRKGRAEGIGHSDGTGICHSYTPDGRCVSLLKLLFTNYCIYDCTYCINRVSSNTERAQFAVKEVIALTLDFYRRNYIEGLFLSSGIVRSPDFTLEQLIEVARKLRSEHKFNGYIHLKTPPGAAPELVAQAGFWADRVSANTELPTQNDLARYAPDRSWNTTENTMKEIRDQVDLARQKPRKRVFAPAGQSTQIIVGLSTTNDNVILNTSTRLYHTYKLRRVYYTGYTPVDDCRADLPQKPVPLVREHRLYQADWLIRFYGFAADEIVPDSSSNLRLDMDPKLAWALRHRDLFPVNINSASREMLLRVPGLGRGSVTNILRIRRHHALRLEDLARLRVALQRTRAFVITADHNPGLALLDRMDLKRKVVPAQLNLFETQASAISGQL